MTFKLLIFIGADYGAWVGVSGVPLLSQPER